MANQSFPGFAWSVPLAFADPVGACRFEAGDILYDSAAGYQRWQEAKQLLKWSIQVTSPMRASVTALRDEDNDVFSRNWAEAVRFNLTHYQDGCRVEEITTTQGRLYSLLWTGNFSFLDANTNPPELPRLLPDAHQELDTIRPELLGPLTEGMGKPTLFLAAFDPCNPGSRAKLQSIRKGLAKFEVIEKAFAPGELQIREADRYAPTISFRGFAVDTGASEKVRDALKEVLYKPARNGVATADRFQLRRHGLFIPCRVSEPKQGLRVKSLAHGQGHFYRLRFDSGRIAALPESLREFVEGIEEGDCPTHLFLEKPTASGLRLELTGQTQRNRKHPIIQQCQASADFEQLKSRHENVQVYFLQNCRLSMVCELPLWLSAEEYPAYKALFPEGGTLTGHIDLLRYEADGNIWIWDFKPNAAAERYAAGQVYAYAVMLSVRTGIPLERIRCGYFDESDAYVFEPATIKLDGSQAGLL